MKDKVVVVGVGYMVYGSFFDRDEYFLVVEVFVKVFDDCGFDKSVIDGMGICWIFDYMVMGEILGFNL